MYAIYNPFQNRPNFDLLNILHNTSTWRLQRLFHQRGYKNRNTAGKEIKDILNSIPLDLIYSDEDPAIYLPCNGTRTTPDLPLVSSDISGLTQPKIIDDPGFGQNPVIASITINSKSMTIKMSTKVLWKFKKADCPKFTNLLKTELNASPINYNHHPDKICNNATNIIIKRAKKTIPRGKVKQYRVFWSKSLEELKRKREVLCNTAGQTGITEDVQAWRRLLAVLRYATLQAKQTTLNRFISNINYQNDN
nr:hypothetical protein HmN_000155100 [Hymenolepis microstoma]